jgi:hypothetical protein
MEEVAMTFQANIKNKNIYFGGGSRIFFIPEIDTKLSPNYHQLNAKVRKNTQIDAKKRNFAMPVSLVNLGIVSCVSA